HLAKHHYSHDRPVAGAGHLAVQPIPPGAGGAESRAVSEGGLTRNLNHRCTESPKKREQKTEDRRQKCEKGGASRDGLAPRFFLCSVFCPLSSLSSVPLLLEIDTQAAFCSCLCGGGAAGLAFFRSAGLACSLCAMKFVR